MPAQFTQGITFLANSSVTNTDLHQLVNNGALRHGAISEQVVQSPSLATADSVLFLDASIPALTQLQLSKLWAEPFQIGQTNKVTADFALVSAPVAQFTSATIPSLVGVSSIAGTTPAIAKAWVTYRGDIAALTAVSFAFVGTTITATKTSHGLVVGDSITMSGGTGNNTVLNGTWVIDTVPNANSFTFIVLSTPAGALATMTVNPMGIFSSFNVRSVAYSALGAQTINFETALPNANYAAVASATQTTSASANNSIGFNPTISPTTSAVSFLNKNSSGTATDNTRYSVVVFSR